MLRTGQGARNAEYGLADKGLERVDGRIQIARFWLRRGTAMVTGTVVVDGGRLRPKCLLGRALAGLNRRGVVQRLVRAGASACLW
jgi:hypothetical protein